MLIKVSNEIYRSDQKCIRKDLYFKTRVMAPIAMSHVLKPVQSRGDLFYLKPFLNLTFDLFMWNLFIANDKKIILHNVLQEPFSPKEKLSYTQHTLLPYERLIFSFRTARIFRSPYKNNRRIEVDGDVIRERVNFLPLFSFP